MEKFVDIKLKSYSIPKHYYSEKSYVKCPDCSQLLHCSYCVHHLRNQNPHHWVGITVNEVPGCRGCRERYLRGIAEARNEATWLRKKLNILEMKLTSHSKDLREAHKLADVKLTAQQLAYEGAESVIEMDLRAQIEDLNKTNDDAESVMGMKLRLELEKMKEAYEGAENRVTFLKRRPPDVPIRGTGLRSTLPPAGDVTLVVQGQKIYAHQLILGCKSRVFQKMFEEELLQPSQKIPETRKQWVEIAPALPSPRPDPPPNPPLSPPAAESHPEKLKEKPGRTERINPVVNVRLTPSAMLEQMGLRGVRCQLSVAPGQSLVDDATSKSSITQLMQDSSDLSSTQNGGNTDVKTMDHGPDLKSPARISDTITVFSPLVNATVHGIQPQAITPQTSHPHASGMTPATTQIPILRFQEAENENDSVTSDFTNVTIPLINEQGRPTATRNVTKSLPTAGSPGVQAIIQVHDTSYAVMRAVVNCCYTADMDFTEEVSPGEVLKVAHKYDIDYLRDVCEKELCRRLNAANLAEMLKLGRKFGATELHSHATQFFKENFDDVQECILNSRFKEC